MLVQRATGTLPTIAFPIDDRAPLHCISNGKALLAYQNAAAIKAAISPGLDRLAHAK